MLLARGTLDFKLERVRKTLLSSVTVIHLSYKIINYHIDTARGGIGSAMRGLSSMGYRRGQIEVNRGHCLCHTVQGEESIQMFGIESL